MPSQQAEALTRVYRTRNQQIVTGLVADVAEAWRLLDPVNVDRTWPAVARIVTQLVARGYSASQALAATYLRTHAGIEGVDLTPLLSPALSPRQVETALLVTGPVAVKQATAAGQSPDRAAATALVRVAGSSTRLALLGGRETVRRTIDRGHGIEGWRRVTDGHPCFFCAMLASRGAVYRNQRTATVRSGGSSRFHDHCACTAEPLYRHEPDPPEVQHLYQRWVDATAGHSGAAAVKAWRAAYEAA